MKARDGDLAGAPRTWNERVLLLARSRLVLSAHQRMAMRRKESLGTRLQVVHRHGVGSLMAGHHLRDIGDRGSTFA
jgi:hypothetical protein